MPVDQAPPNPSPENRPTRRALLTARWLAPGASQTISSVGNALLALVSARWMTGEDFGLFMLGYSGVLLVSQLFRVAVGEAGLLATHDNESRWRSGPLFIGAALTITPVLGLSLIHI